MRLYFGGVAARAAIHRNQLPGFYIELLVFPHHPFVEALATEGFAACFFARWFFTEGYNVSHCGYQALCPQRGVRWPRSNRAISSSLRIGFGTGA